ncbi:thiamine diphosphokinase [Companilactobacillus metriopterae]|uniref:thiamine diphosphokinase n=1 Tax=Companilactobacillus metriopterae TaxID=1909267 RepID=UPI00100AE117|nr:thiamine diphosphokinase [Companilactobacillus metriopterae]
MVRVNILLGGPSEDYPQDFVDNPKDIPGYWAGADRGNLYLLQHGITPDLAVGDFDSIDQADRELIESKVNDVHQYPPEKDDTDSELVMLIANDKYNADEYYIYGGTSGRIDHFLVNLFLPFDERFESFFDKIKFVSNTNTIEFRRPGSYTVTKEENMKYIGFVGLGAVDNLSILDAKYKLSNFNSDHPISWASNEFVNDKIHYSFDSGVVAVIQSRDKKKD